MKIILVGNSEIGKATLAHIMASEFPVEVVVGADADDLMRSVRHPQSDSLTIFKCYLRALYHLQVELENISVERHPGKLILFNHGTLDCLENWPDAKPLFLKEVNTYLEKELARYDWVIWIVNFLQSNLTDTHWQLHPRFLILPARNGFSFCCSELSKILRNILEGQSYEEVCEKLTVSLDGNLNPKIPTDFEQ